MAFKVNNKTIKILQINIRQRNADIYQHVLNKDISIVVEKSKQNLEHDLINYENLKMLLVVVEIQKEVDIKYLIDLYKKANNKVAVFYFVTKKGKISESHFTKIKSSAFFIKNNAVLSESVSEFIHFNVVSEFYNMKYSLKYFNEKNLQKQYDIQQKSKVYLKNRYSVKYFYSCQINSYSKKSFNEVLKFQYLKPKHIFLHIHTKKEKFHISSFGDLFDLISCKLNCYNSNFLYSEKDDKEIFLGYFLIKNKIRFKEIKLNIHNYVVTKIYLLLLYFNIYEGKDQWRTHNKGLTRTLKK